MRALCFLMILSFLTLCETGWRRTPLPAWPMSNHTRANRTRLFTNFTAARLAPLVEIIASSLDRLEAAIDSLHETTEIHMHNQRRAVMRARQLLWDNDDDWPAPDKDWPVLRLRARRRAALHLVWALIASASGAHRRSRFQPRDLNKPLAPRI